MSKYKIDTISEPGYIYINDKNGKHMSWEELEKTLNDQDAKIQSLKEEKEDILEELALMANLNKEKKIEIEHINNIYKELGFDGVIEYAEDQLDPYGTVREVESGLWLLATGGWSDNEFLLDCLTNFLCYMSWNGHYMGYLRGGAFYFTKEKWNRKFRLVDSDE